mgnify:CR=1 FL=1
MLEQLAYERIAVRPRRRRKDRPDEELLDWAERHCRAGKDRLPLDRLRDTWRAVLAAYPGPPSERVPVTVAYDPSDGSLYLDRVIGASSDLEAAMHAALEATKQLRAVAAADDLEATRGAVREAGEAVWRAAWLAGKQWPETTTREAYYAARRAGEDPWAEELVQNMIEVVEADRQSGKVATNIARDALALTLGMSVRRVGKLAKAGRERAREAG